VLFGAHLAEKSGLKHKLITNQERLELICEILKDDSLSAASRFTGIEDMVSTVNEYRYVIETGLVIQTMIGAIQAAAKALLESGTGLDPAVNPRLSDLASAKRSADGYEVLVALQAWHDVMPKGALEPKSPEDIMRRLTEIVWHYNFRRYFWMKEQRDNDKNAQAAE